MAPDVVPLYILRVPVRYYRQPPVYFGGWQANAPPRWGEYWGNSWEQSRSGWDNWNRRAVPAPAPLPVYQRQYSGNRYPHVEQQQAIQSRNYRYQPRDAAVRQQYQAQRVQAAPQGARPQQPQRGGQDAARAQPPSRQGQPAAQRQAQPPSQGTTQRPPPPRGQSPDQGSQGKGAAQQPRPGPDKGQPKAEQQGGERHK